MVTDFDDKGADLIARNRALLATAAATRAQARAAIAIGDEAVRRAMEAIIVAGMEQNRRLPPQV
jgi:hypothetical protein